MNVYASGIEQYIEIGNQIMPFGYHNCPLHEQRQMFANYAVELPFEQSDEVKFEHVIIEGVKCGRYALTSSCNNDAIVYFHGGGFVLGGINSHSDLANSICYTTGRLVYLVDYRLAPEHQYPAALKDSVKIVNSLLRKGIQITVAGESSGGNIAAYIGRVFAARDDGSGLRKVALFCPVLNFDRWSSGGEDAPRLSGGEMMHFVSCYTEGKVSPSHIDISPILHDDAFSVFPPTYLAYASEDSLSVDACELAEQLSKSGVEHTLTCHQGLVHACLRARTLSTETERAFQEFCSGMSYA